MCLSLFLLTLCLGLLFSLFFLVSYSFGLLYLRLSLFSLPFFQVPMLTPISEQKALISYKLCSFWALVSHTDTEGQVEEEEEEKEEEEEEEEEVVEEEEEGVEE